ncbi:ABC transporter ATP-binding protein [Luteimonas aquatica]|uniref:ABC transporter ATP-binding protein n=1 Tax=Luteimonas aquatica TaxID=450364 RepID=UPI001F5A9DFA|nr:ABC transporter ATP-binding protein [Luteimonas aquatica]
MARRLLRIAAYARPYRWRIVLGTLLVLLGTASILAFPLAVAAVVDAASNKADLGKLHLLAAGILLLFVVRAAIAAVGGYLLDVVGERLVLDLRHDLFAHLMRLDLDFFHREKVGDLSSRLSTDTAAIRNAVTETTVSVLNQLSMLVGSALMMAFLNWRLTLIILLLAPTTTALSRHFGRIMEAASKRVQEQRAAVSSVAQESISGIAVVKVLSRSEHEIDRYSGSLARLLASSLGSIRISTWFRTHLYLLTSLTTVAIFWYGGLQIYSGRISAGQLVAFLFYAQNISQAFAAFAQLYSNLSQAAGASTRVFELMALTPSIETNADAAEPPRSVGRVRFEDIGFWHVPGRPILERFNLAVTSGEIVILSGESGCGKTTAVQLLPRLFDPCAGRILVDGHDIREVPLRWLREQVALVSQDAFLFGGTVLENIRYGRLDASDEEVEQAARAASAHEFIATMPQGYDSEVGERGVRISGGQRQRLALARAFLRRAPILVLDEATSGVDSATEEKIHETVYRWCKREGITALIVAHRSAALRLADRIVVMERGGIVREDIPDTSFPSDASSFGQVRNHPARPAARKEFAAAEAMRLDKAAP